MQTETAIHTIQLWPSGETISYSGDLVSYTIHEDGQARSATLTETHQIQVNLYAHTLLDREVLANQSSLIDKLLRDNAFEYDEIENLYPDPSAWDEEQCRAWLDDNGVGNDADADLEDLQDTIRENASPAEVYEWWLVSPYLADTLREIGEPVLDNDYGVWWGRTCTGQSVIMDGTLQRAAELILSR